MGPELVYVVTSEQILGLDVTDGDTAWRTQSSTDADVALAPETLFLRADFTSPEPALTALELSTHESRWQVQYPTVFPPTAVDETVYVTASPDFAGEDGLQARKLQSGTVDWAFETSAIEHPEAVSDGTLYVTTMGQPDEPTSARPPGVYALSIADGAVEWYFDKRRWGPSILDGDLLLVGTDTVKERPPRVTALDAVTGTKRWSYEGPTAGEWNYVWPVQAGGDMVFVRTAQHIQALDRATGTRQWETRGDPAGGAQLNQQGQLVYVRRGRTIVAIRVGDGTEKWSYTLPQPDQQAGTVQFWVHEDEVFGVSGRTITSLRAGSGESNWQFTAEALLTDVTIDENVIYLTTTEGVSALRV